MREGSVQQARGRDGEDGGELFEDDNAGIACAAFEFADIDTSESRFEAHMLLRPLFFCSEHSQIASKAMSNIHTPIAPEASPKSSN
jgi:hypothetical protein